MADGIGGRTFPKHIEIIDDTTAAILRKKTEGERLAIAFRMWDFAKGMIEANLRAEHPDWSEEEVRHKVAERMSHGAV